MTTPAPLLARKTWSRFPQTLAAPTLAEECRALLTQQRAAWPQAGEGYASLDAARVKRLQCDGYEAFLQFNPKRIISTGAKVDPGSIRERRCFLCLEHLPDPQMGILYEERFLILCNPAPIFRQHFTITSITHTPQTLDGQIGVMLRLARDLAPGYAVFYNGPRCGTSAPDHMHFQASPINAIPVEIDAADGHRRRLRKNVGDVPISTMEHYGREVFVLESGTADALERALATLIGAMKAAAGTTEEPMMNVIAGWRDGRWRVIVFPRRKHRPDVYFKEGEEKILISPAAVDIGGLIVTPVQKDFERVDASTVASIFREVSVTANDVEHLLSLI